MDKNEKKAYKKPVIKSEKIIETAALACGKCLSGGPIFQAACQAKSRTS
jgi:hypothetical protein